LGPYRGFHGTALAHKGGRLLFYTVGGHVSSTSSNLAILNDLCVGGGVERVLTQLVEEVFAADQPTVFLYQSAPFEALPGATVVSLELPVPPYSSIVAEAAVIGRAWWALRDAKRRSEIAVCISHKEGPNFANVLSGRTKTLVTVHEAKSSGLKYRGFKRWLTRNVIRILYNRADRVVTVSQGIAEDLVQNFGVNPKRIRVITNPCDVAGIKALALAPLPPELVRDPARPTLITVGRLEAQKGQWHLIRAFSRVREKLPSARLVIVGTGETLPYLERLVSGLKLEEAVIFTGFIKNPYALLASADVFVSSSLWEGFPLVLAEAMACRLPVIAADCPTGAREILAPRSTQACGSAREPEWAEYGVLTPPMNGEYYGAQEPLDAAEETLATVCLKMLSDPGTHQHYVEQGRQRVEDFSMTNYAAQWRTLVSEVRAS
jgi:glycosyltransferase involved in cell wall biosynthesis